MQHLSSRIQNTIQKMTIKHKRRRMTIVKLDIKLNKERKWHNHESWYSVYHNMTLYFYHITVYTITVAQGSLGW